MSYTFNPDVRPSTVKSASTHNYVSSLDLVQGLHEPEVDSQLTMRYGSQDLTGFIDMMGGMNPVGNIEYSHYEDNWLHEVIRPDGAASIAGGAGGLHTYTVGSGDIGAGQIKNSNIRPRPEKSRRKKKAKAQAKEMAKNMKNTFKESDYKKGGDMKSTIMPFSEFTKK